MRACSRLRPNAELSLAGVLLVLPVAIVFLFSQRLVTSSALTGSIKD